LLIDHFGNAENIYHAQPVDYIKVNGISHSTIKHLSNKELDTSKKIISSCDELGYKIITLKDPGYPERLSNVYDPPLVLYVNGNLPDIDDELAIGIVGTRRCTPYGVSIAENVSYELSNAGIIIVTGLALGVDTAATRGALRGGTKMVGVIGSGLDVVFPAENRILFENVADNGAVISEYPPGTTPFPANFPARNRIISGLSLGVAVIEAPKRSGALITASFALEQGRDVFALPGNVDAPACRGSNKLLRDGAIPFTCADDIIEEYIEQYQDKITTKNEDEKIAFDDIAKNTFDKTIEVDYIDLGRLIEKLDGDNKIIAQTIGKESMFIDDIITDTGLTAQQVLSALTMLELEGHINRDVNGKWAIQFE